MIDYLQKGWGLDKGVPKIVKENHDWGGEQKAEIYYGYNENITRRHLNRCLY